MLHAGPRSRLLLFPLLGALAAAIGILVAEVAPRPVAAQLPPPPHLLYGEIAAITIDGEPYGGDAPIQAVSGGDVVATADVAEGQWAVQIPAGYESIRFRIGEAVSEPIEVVSGAITQHALTLTTGGGGGEEPPAGGRRVELAAGFQSLTHSGETQAVGDFLNHFGDPDAVAAIFLWGADAQTWRAWHAGLPEALQGITTIEHHAPLLLLLDRATVYESGVIGHAAGDWPLHPGFTAVAYLDGEAVLTDALADIEGGGSVAAIFRFNNGTQGWDAYNSGLPEGLSTLTALQRWDMLLVVADGEAAWGYQAVE